MTGRTERRRARHVTRDSWHRACVRPCPEVQRHAEPEALPSPRERPIPDAGRARVKRDTVEPELQDDEHESAGEDACALGFSRCNLPPWVIASREFQDHPRGLHVVGVRRENGALFSRLSSIDDPDERARVFDAYMNVKFNLEEWRAHTAPASRSIRNSYLRFLRGWGVDSSSIEGAVLKGWVESRLGIPPRYHRGPITVGTRSYVAFARDRMLGHARSNALDAQLDLLFEFCQYELRRRGLRWFDLYRGTYDADQHPIVARRGRREYAVVLNNLCSFTADVNKAWEFGSKVWKVRVPAQRVFYFAGLLPKTILRGEDEHLVFGGEHWVKEIV